MKTENPIQNVIQGHYELHTITTDHGWFSDNWQTTFNYSDFVNFLDLKEFDSKVLLKVSEQLSLRNDNYGDSNLRPHWIAMGRFGRAEQLPGHATGEEPSASFDMEILGGFDPIKQNDDTVVFNDETSLADWRSSTGVTFEWLEAFFVNLFSGDAIDQIDPDDEDLGKNNFISGGWFNGLRDLQDDPDLSPVDAAAIESPYILNFNRSYMSRFVDDQSTQSFNSSTSDTEDSPLWVNKISSNLHLPILTTLIHANDIVQYLKLLPLFDDSDDFYNLFYFEDYRTVVQTCVELISDILNSGDHSIAIVYDVGFQQRISVGDNVGLDDNGNPHETADDFTCSFRDKVTFNLSFAENDQAQSTSEGGVVSFASEFILKEKNNIAGAIYDRSRDGKYLKRNPNEVSKVAATMDLEFCEALNQWSAGTHVKNAYVYSDVIPPITRTGDIDQLEGGDTATMTKNQKTPVPGKGMAMPIVDGNNSTQWVPLTWDASECGPTDTQKVILPVLNFTGATFERGEIAKISKISGQWQIEKYYPGEPALDKNCSNWEFTSCVQNAKTFFRLPTTDVFIRRLAGYPKGTDTDFPSNNGVDASTKHYSIWHPVEFERAYNQQYYQNIDTTEGEVNPKSYSRANLASHVHYQISSWDFLAPNWGGWRGKSALSTCQYGVGSNGEILDHNPGTELYEKAYATFPFFGAIFPGGYDIDGFRRNNLSGPDLKSILGEDIPGVVRNTRILGRNASGVSVEGGLEQVYFFQDIPAETYPLDPDIKGELYDNFLGVGNGICTESRSTLLLDQVPADIAMNSPYVEDFGLQAGGPGTSLSVLNRIMYINPDDRELQGKPSDLQDIPVIKNIHAYRQRLNKELVDNRNMNFWQYFGSDDSTTGEDVELIDSPAWGLTPKDPNIIEFRPLKAEVITCFDFFAKGVNWAGWWTLNSNQGTPNAKNFITHKKLMRGVLSFQGQRAFGGVPTDYWTMPLSLESNTREYHSFSAFSYNEKPPYETELDERRQYLLASPLQQGLGVPGKFTLQPGGNGSFENPDPVEVTWDGEAVRGISYFQDEQTVFGGEGSEAPKGPDNYDPNTKEPYPPNFPVLCPESVRTSNYPPAGYGRTNKVLRLAYNEDFHYYNVEYPPVPGGGRADGWEDRNGKIACVGDNGASWANTINWDHNYWSYDDAGGQWGCSDSAGGVIGVIGAQFKCKADVAINLDTLNNIGQQFWQNSNVVGDKWNPSWGNKNTNGFMNFNTTELWAIVYHSWPKSQTVYDPRWFVVHHFNAGMYDDGSPQMLPIFGSFTGEDITNQSSGDGDWLVGQNSYDSETGDWEVVVWPQDPTLVTGGILGITEGDREHSQAFFTSVTLTDGNISTQEATGVFEIYLGGLAYRYTGDPPGLQMGKKSPALGIHFKGTSTPPTSANWRAWKLKLQTVSGGFGPEFTMTAIPKDVIGYEGVNRYGLFRGSEANTTIGIPLLDIDVKVPTDFSDGSNIATPQLIDQDHKLADYDHWNVNTMRRGLLLPTNENEGKGIPIPTIGNTATYKGELQVKPFHNGTTPLEAGEYATGQGLGYRKGDRFQCKPTKTPAGILSTPSIWRVVDVVKQDSAGNFGQIVELELETYTPNTIPFFEYGAGFMPEEVAPIEIDVEGTKKTLLKLEPIIDPVTGHSSVNGTGAEFYIQNLYVYDRYYWDDKPGSATLGEEGERIRISAQSEVRYPGPIFVDEISESVKRRLFIRNPSEDGEYDVFLHFHNDISHTFTDRNTGADPGISKENRILLNVTLE